MLENKKYLFDSRVSSALQQGSLAFAVSFSRRIEGNPEIQTAVRITKSLLPQHCDLNLIEDALAHLEKHPQDDQLLKTLGEYTKNSLSERIGYWGMGGGSTVRTSFVPLAPILFMTRLTAVAGLLAVATIAPPITIPLIGAAVVLGAWNLYRNGSIGMKIGRWIGNLLKGTGQKSANLTECEDSLKACVNKYKTAAEQKISSMLAHQASNIYPSFKEPVPEKMLSPQVSAEPVAEKMPGPQVSAEVDAKSSYGPFFKNPDEAKDSANNTLHSSLESTGGTHTP